SQVQLGPYGPILHVSVQTETELLADGAHLVVLRQHRRAQPPQFLIASHRNETTVQFCTQPQVLESVMDEHRQLGLVAPVQLTHATHCYDLRRPACRSEEHTSELQSRGHLVCRLLLEKK